jgi:hypothetical protein
LFGLWGRAWARDGGRARLLQSIPAALLILRRRAVPAPIVVALGQASHAAIVVAVRAFVAAIVFALARSVPGRVRVILARASTVALAILCARLCVSVARNLRRPGRAPRLLVARDRYGWPGEYRRRPLGFVASVTPVPIVRGSTSAVPSLTIVWRGGATASLLSVAFASAAVR